ncbi:rhomboid family intramembrane serine protease [Caldimonas sp. KR1-144]|uniref:rhomboid family intramembrane serine protease n=1 Tax=Caldimonas sp. KR1-144 TaxID=3400911 RepID=UPI003BFCD5A9
MPPIPSVTRWLLILCVGIFCAQQIPALRVAEALLALWPLGSGMFWPWQPVTYAFLHADPTHLLFNMLGLWMFGAELERVWGYRRFMQFMAASILSAALVNLMWSAMFGSNAPTVGISGGVYGLLLAYGVLFPHRQVMLLIPPMPVSARTLVIIFGVISLVYGVAPGAGGVAHFAHLGGMLGGWLMIKYWRGQPPFGRRR